MPHLAVALAVPDTAAALAAMHRAAGRADLAELRLDLMDEFDLPALLAGRPLPVIVTCRPPREGGRWQGSEAERLAVLRQAAALGADYVDLEWDAAGEIAALDRSRTRVILSRHDFSAMPDDLPARAASLWQAGADVVKLVGMARRLADCAPVLRLLAEATRPTIAIAMGPQGLLTRVLAFRYRHALLSFAAPDPPAGVGAAVAGTAPGQITLSAMYDLYRTPAIDQATAFIGLLTPDALALALVEGNRWLNENGRHAVLIPLSPAPGEDLAAALAAIQPAAGLLGCLLPTPTGFAVLNRSDRQLTPAHDSHSVILSGSDRQLTPARDSHSVILSGSDRQPPPARDSHSVILSGSDRQPPPARDSHSVILSGSDRQLTPAHDSSEESPLPTSWPRRAHAVTITDALRRLLDDAPEASMAG